MRVAKMKKKAENSLAKKRRKVGTILDADLYTALKIQAAREGKPMASVLSEALVKYMARTPPVEQIVKDTYGAFRVSDRSFREVIDLDPWNP